MMSLAVLGVAALALAAHGQSLPQDRVKRDAAELRQTYDFVILGGGTAGLTVADRLTEAFPDRKCFSSGRLARRNANAAAAGTVLVVELGELVYAPGVNEPPGYPAPLPGWRITSRPNPGLNGRIGGVTIGKAVGGGTTINGQFFDRGSASDYDAWAALGSPEFDDYEDKWDWEGLLPYFKKSVTFTEPTKESTVGYGYTWDADAAYGGNTPIHASFPPFQWPMQALTWKAWVDTGVGANRECAAGTKVGMCWVPSSQHPYTARRSHAGTGHFLDAIDRRPNYDLLVLHRAIRVQYARGAGTETAVLDGGPPRVEVRAEGSNATTWVTATQEVIVAAGALNTPLILQRSGIGPKGVLDKAGVEQIVDLPGVGQNFHDHGGLTYKATFNVTITPNADILATNTSFRDQAVAEYEQRPARGPYTLAFGNSAS
ncbi:hypothetical protein MAPG_05935 [Magnaporthiopsis poae ATCC 64411]|uniref:Glucose-methanol-choline oxidoreductase N-terminal domain-containing protein n=1 Tax=Magnaporthiopsis poae (strain ATCC 64411 / 73-15) TaxID=644358 RepID=A0A0C4E0Q3_MAGP6|nr:hypothetical protein MAPG_05935 [Magnaporthiopsis poae ATCC 64411]